MNHKLISLFMFLLIVFPNIGFSIQIYTYNDTTQKSAYISEQLSNPPTTRDFSETEATSTNYNQISISDNSRWYYQGGNCEGYQTQKFNITLNESAMGVEFLNLTIEGFGCVYTCSDANSDYNVYIWNIISDGWELIENNPDYGDDTIIWNTTDATNIVDENKTIIFLAQSIKSACWDVFTYYSKIYTDYIEVDVIQNWLYEVSVFDNSTGNPMINWSIYITNGTLNYNATNQNNPAYFQGDEIPYGDINITISDGSDTKYYYNTTTNVSNNESIYNELNINLVEKADNPITITSTSGISLQDGDTTTISCTNAEGTPAMTINSINVSIPYTLTVQQGQYVVFCEVNEETENYGPMNDTMTIIVNPLIACTNNNTFAFRHTVTPESNLTTFNFTTAVSGNYLKSDLSDVYVPGANDTWTNFTNGYYITVNNTGLSTINVYFGNYFSNRSYSTHELSSNVTEIAGFTQINPAVIYTIMDEFTGIELYPPDSTLTSIIQCSEGESYIPIYENDTKVLIASTEYITKASVRVSYTADSYYSRQLYPTEQNMLLLNFYVADAYETALDRIDFKMLDSDEYSSKLQVYKTIEDATVVITEGYFDVSRYFSAYLIEDSDYWLKTIDGSGTETEYGRITVVTPAEKELGQASMTLNPESVLIANNISMNSWTNDARTSIYITYSDSTNQTNQINITTYFENGTIFHQESYDDTNSVNLEYNITDYENDTFSIVFSIEHETFGNSPVTYTMSVANSILWDIGVSSYVYNLACMIIIVLAAGTATRKTFVGGVFIFIVSILILRSIGWLSMMSDVTLVFLIILCLIGIFVWIKQGGE